MLRQMFRKSEETQRYVVY